MVVIKLKELEDEDWGRQRIYGSVYTENTENTAHESTVQEFPRDTSSK